MIHICILSAYSYEQIRCGFFNSPIISYKYIMTSWLKLNVVKPLEKKNSLMFETTDGGFCSQFNQYLYAVLYSEKEQLPLIVNDSTNAVSIRYPLIKNTFTTDSSITFTDTQVLTSTPLKRRVASIRTFVNDISSNELRLHARKIFTWNPLLLVNVQQMLDEESIPFDFDVGVHIRIGGEQKPISVDSYIRQIKTYQSKEKKKTLTVFIMTDSSKALDEFLRKKDVSWNVHHFKSPLSVNGHVQREFNAANSRTRMNAYMNFIAELVSIQRAEHIVCSFSSNVGRFLYLTAEDYTSVASVDIPKFIPF